MERLRAAEHGGERLDRGADDVVLRLLGGEGRAAGLGVEAQHHGARVLGAEALFGEVRPHPARRAELRDLLDEVREGGVEEREARRELVEVEAGFERGLAVGDGVGEGERHLLDGGAAGLAHVVAADADGVPGRQVVLAPAEDVGDEPHRALGREDVGAAGDVLLEDVVLGGAADLREVGALLLGDRDVEGEEDRAGGVDGHRGRHLLERDVLHQEFHVGERRDRDADLADLARRHRVVGVVADLGREVEGYGEAGLALLEQVAVAGVRLLGVAEAGVLAHGPEAAAVHRGLDAAGVGELAGEAELGEVVPAVHVIGTYRGGRRERRRRYRTGSRAQAP